MDNRKLVMITGVTIAVLCLCSVIVVFGWGYWYYTNFDNFRMQGQNNDYGQYGVKVDGVPLENSKFANEYFTLDYDLAWEKSSTPDQVQLFSPDSRANLIADFEASDNAIRPADVTTDFCDNFNEGFYSESKAGNPGMAKPKVEVVKINGYAGCKLSAIKVMAGDVEIDQEIILVVNPNNELRSVRFILTSASGADDLKQKMADFVDSLVFK